MKNINFYVIVMMIFAVNNLITGSDISPKSSNELTQEQLKQMSKFVELQRTNNKLKKQTSSYGQPPRKLSTDDLKFLSSIKGSKQIKPAQQNIIESPQGAADYPFSPQKENRLNRPNRYANYQDSDEESN